MKIIDTHCHLYLQEFKDDFEQVLQRARAIGVEKFYLPGIDSSVIPDMFAVEEKYPAEFVAMIGLHPGSVKEDYKDELKICEALLAKRNFVAIGEIGLDLYWDTTFKHEQQQAFNQQMEWAVYYNIPIVIHTRNAMQQTIKLVKPFAAKGLTGIFHCFGDGFEVAKQIMDLNFMMGIGGVLTYKKSGLDDALKNVPIENLVLETDAPYLTPVPYRGKRNESSYLSYVIKKLATVKNISEEEVAAITTANAEKIFGS